MIFRDKIDQIFASLEPSPTVYKLTDTTWGRKFHLTKTRVVQASVKADSFLFPIVLSHTDETLSEDLTCHELTLNRDRAIDRALHECVSSCKNFIEKFSKSKHPRQGKLFKYFNNMPIHKLVAQFNYEDMLYSFSEHIGNTEFTGADDPNAKAILAALQILKDKMITELNIEEPTPRKRRS